MKLSAAGNRSITALLYYDSKLLLFSGIDALGQELNDF